MFFLVEKILKYLHVPAPALLNDPVIAQKISFVIHAPSALILILFFLRKWLFLLRNIVRCRFVIARLIFYVALANSITVCFYLLLSFICVSLEYFLPFGFAITGIILASLYWIPYEKNNSTMTWHIAIMLGIAQGVALLPGISRFAATYVIGRWMGLRAQRAFELSFAIQFPLIAAASVFGLFSVNHIMQITMSNPITLLIIVIASLIAWRLLELMYVLVIKNEIQWLSWYLLVPLMISLFFI